MVSLGNYGVDVQLCNKKRFFANPTGASDTVKIFNESFHLQLDVNNCNELCGYDMDRDTNIKC